METATLNQLIDAACMALGISVLACVLVFRYGKQLLACSFLLVPVALLFMIQRHADFSSAALLVFSILTIGMALGLEQVLNKSKTELSARKVKILADWGWAVVPTCAVVSVVTSIAAKQEARLEIGAVLACLGIASLAIFQSGRRRLPRLSRVKTGPLSFDLKALLLAGPLGCVLFLHASIAGASVYFAGVALFYSGIIQLPGSKRDSFQPNPEKMRKRIGLGLAIMLMGLGTMLVGLGNVMSYPQ